MLVISGLLCVREGVGIVLKRLQPIGDVEATGQQGYLHSPELNSVVCSVSRTSVELCRV